MRHVIVMAALVWFLWSPAVALGGGPVAWTIEKTCEPGGPLVLAPDFARSDFRTRPGEVVGCARAGASTFQIAVEPVRFEGREELCVYFTIEAARDGDDICIVDTTQDFSPLMVIRGEGEGQLALAGVGTSSPEGAEVFPADAAFNFISVPYSEKALCSALGDSLPGTLRLLDATDKFVVATSVQRLCPDPPAWVLEVSWRAGKVLGTLA